MKYAEIDWENLMTDEWNPFLVLNAWYLTT